MRGYYSYQSACPSVIGQQEKKKNKKTLDNNFEMVRDRAFKFHDCNPCDITFILSMEFDLLLENTDLISFLSLRTKDLFNIVTLTSEFKE